MERFFVVAGTVFRVTAADGQMCPEEGALSAYRAAPCSWDHTLEMEIADVLPAPVGELVFSDPGKRVYQDGQTQLRYEGAVEHSPAGAHMSILRRGNTSRVTLRRSSAGSAGAVIAPRLILRGMEAEHHIAARGGFLLHASYICYDGRAILFTAPSSTGKSTQAELWQRLRGAQLVNGDRAAVLPGGMVHGIPFSGSSGVSKNVTAPLAAIVYLSQAPVTTLAPLTGVRAFRRIWEGCSVNIWNRTDMSACTQAVLDTAAAIPVFHLACTPDEPAVAALEQALDMRR